MRDLSVTAKELKKKKEAVHSLKNLPKVAIIILNYNGWQDTIEYLGDEK